MTDFEHQLKAGLSSANADQWEAAITAFHNAVQLAPDSFEANFRLGWAIWHRATFIKPSTTDLAIGYSAQLLGIKDIAQSRGRKFTQHHRMLKDASFWLRRAIVIEPDSVAANSALALVVKELGHRAEAIEIAERTLGLDPNDRDALELLHSLKPNSASPHHTAETSVAQKLTWNDLVLPEQTKRELRQMQLMLEQPDLARELGVEPPSGILLKGPPGTGKTTIARVLANEAKCAFFSITPAEINQMYVGESEKRVKGLFEQARAAAPSIIFVDEIDALLPIRAGGVSVHSDKVVNQFLQEMDGMRPNHRVFLIGATNRPDMLDPAVRRGGRLSREIEIPLPDRNARRALFSLYTQIAKVNPEVDLDKLADDCAGLSGADIRAIVNEAGLQAMIRINDHADSERQLLPEDFEIARRNLAAEHR